MSMVGWLNLLSGTGMIAVGAIAVYVWRRRAGAGYFLLGAVSWAAAIAVKIAMDLTVTPSLKAFLPHALSGVLVLGLYYGLRTGLFESGFPYAAARVAKLAPTFDQAIAAGIGAGAAEAIVLGLLSLLNVLTFILMPGLIGTYPPATQASLQLQFSLPFLPIPVWERLFALFCHVFAMALAMYALRAGWQWLGLSIAFMTLLDGALIPLLVYVTLQTYVDNLLIEAFVGAMGLVSVAGLFILRGIYDRHAPQA
ncbi:MAG TPA: YhfC family glutamic-type intramembrane protease [Methanocella sp.]|jgi:hypothetical protein